MDNKKIQISFGNENESMRTIVSGNTIHEIAEVLCEIGHPDFINEFVKTYASILSQEDKKSLSDIILKTGKHKTVIKYVENAKLEDSEEFEKKVINEFVKPEDILKYVRKAKCNNIEGLTEAYIKQGGKELTEFALAISKYDGSEESIRKIEDAVCNSGDAEEIRMFTYYIADSDKEKMADALVRTESVEDIIYHAARETKLPIDKLEDGIIKIGVYEHMIEFAQKVSGANIGKLQKAICETQNYEAMFRFATEVSGADIREIWHSIKNSNDKTIIKEYKNRFKAKGHKVY